MRIAVIGAGIAGLAASWLLARKHRVTLFEAADYLGGHTHTTDVTLDGVTAPVDTGFLVFNSATYPNLIALFDELGVQSTASEMSFSVRIEKCRLEWAGSSLASVFAQKRNLVNVEFWRMLKDLLRFNRETTAMVGSTVEQTLDEFLTAGKYGRAFRDWYLLPMAAAIWSCPTAQILQYPMLTFVRFCHNHGLLRINNRPQWRSVIGGGREYVARLAAGIPDIRLRTPIARISRGQLGQPPTMSGRLAREHPITIETQAGALEAFDHVILACHSDQALALLADADQTEHRLLSALRYQQNRAILHTDTELLPRKRLAWSAWNYHADGQRSNGGPDGNPVAVSYLINKLQPLPFKTPVIVTLNPEVEPRNQTVLARYDYAHPVFDRPAIRAQSQLSKIQGARRTWFCGAWLGYGFHEDGLNSALAVAHAFGIEAPWRRSLAAA